MLSTIICIYVWIYIKPYMDSLLSQYVEAILKLLRQKTQIQIQVGKDKFTSTSYTREITGPNKLFWKFETT